MTTVIFSHGKESGPWGNKITTLAKVVSDVGFRFDSIDYQDLPSPEDRVERLVNTIKNLDDDVILVGSSMGGYVSLVAAEQVQVKGVFLMAPALSMPNYQVQQYNYRGNICIIHGWGDEVIPISHSVDFARLTRAKLIVLDDGHRLATSMSSISPFFRNWLAPFKIK